MSLRDNFFLGQVVRPSRLGLRAHLWVRVQAPTSGIVAAKPHPGSLVTVRWDNRKTASQYHKSFISPAWRMKLASKASARKRPQKEELKP